MIAKQKLPLKWRNSKPARQTPQQMPGRLFVFLGKFWTAVDYLIFWLARETTRQKPVKRKHLRQQQQRTPELTTEPTIKVSRAKRAIKDNISTLVGEVISILLPLLLLVDGDNKAIIHNKDMASHSNFCSSESLKGKRVSKQRQDLFFFFMSSYLHTYIHTLILAFPQWFQSFTVQD